MTLYISMKKILIASLLSAVAATCLTAKSLEGEYLGKIENPKGPFKENPLVAVQVYREGDLYKVGIYSDLLRRCPPYATFSAKADSKKIDFETNGWTAFKGTITEKGIEGFGVYNEGNEKKTVPMSLKKVNRKSPTLGKRAPKGAVVLFNGKSLEHWKSTKGGEITWKLMDDGSVMAYGPKNQWGYEITTKDKFKNFKLHVEFMIPDERNKPLGQGRGNSGVFLGMFEVQVLDSFGAQGVWNDCGALYKYLPPQVNASLPPEKWQTYDIEYHAPVLKDGKIAEYPRITVIHNGIKIHGDVEIKEQTANGSAYRSLAGLTDAPVAITLQNHLNPVRYRNIWIQELEK